MLVKVKILHETPFFITKCQLEKRTDIKPNQKKKKKPQGYMLKLLINNITMKFNKQLERNV